ncbi:PD40 domain-containing protein, partial [bacterium]|nr:PD40 domain-containing protein [bacterium]
MSVKIKLITLFVFLVVILLIVSFCGVFYPYLPGSIIGGLSIIYPFDGSLFPPEIASPVFRWNDKTFADSWILRFEFQDTDNSMEKQTNRLEWTPERAAWEMIKERTLEKSARFTVIGFRKIFGIKIYSAKQTISIKTSRDEVGAPIFYRDVPLPFRYAIEHKNEIKWRLGDISSDDPPPVILENLTVCGNCHSFSSDGKVLGMDVDYANDKGSYVITDVSEEIKLTADKLITWTDYKREDRELTFGLLSRISPDGKYVVSTVKDRSVFVPVSDLYYSQLFFPLKGILACYNRETHSFRSLPGADDKRFVQSNPAWSPDGKHIVFAKNKAESLGKIGSKVVLSNKDCEQYLTGGKKFRYDLYRIAFNDGKGGEAVALEGASHNGMSNYFAKYSPDGKWIVFCKANSFMLLQPDSRLYIIPAEGGKPREMRCNTNEMNSWH